MTTLNQWRTEMNVLKSIVALCVLSGSLLAQQRFSDLVGPVGVENVKDSPDTSVPYLTWGGDVAAFRANGDSLQTAKGSYYDQLGLNLKFTNGDDFIQQVRDYMGGKTPFLRGTFDMIGMASEVVGSDPRTEPVVIVQLTWSAGDYVVARQNIKNLNDLTKSNGKKVKVCAQQGGPHAGLIYKILLAAQATKQQVEIVWAKDLTGPEGPAALFAKDTSIDVACVITPDMIGLTGGAENVGTGAEGSVQGAHVIVSTQQMSRAIADVWAVRSDWYKSHQDAAEKFVSGYLHGCEDVVVMRKGFVSKLSNEYRKTLQVAQDAFGKKAVPSLEVDGHGLLLDAVFVGLPGQISFFNDPANLNGFDSCLKSTLDFTVTWGYAQNRMGFKHADFNYQEVAKLAGVKFEAPAKINRINAEAVDLFPDSDLDDKTILSFDINFEPDQTEFSADQYGSEFQRAIQSASTFGNSVVVIRGHSDPTKTLVDLIQAGLAKGVLTRSGKSGNYKYFFDGKELNLDQTGKIVDLIKKGAFDGTSPSPRETMQAALNLSKSRAESVTDAIVEYAKSQNVNLDKSQIQPVGASILEPLIAKPRNMQEAKQNMRVEFRIIKVAAEALQTSDFDY